MHATPNPMAKATFISKFLTYWYVCCNILLKLSLFLRMHKYYCHLVTYIIVGPDLICEVRRVIFINLRLVILLKLYKLTNNLNKIVTS